MSSSKKVHKYHSRNATDISFLSKGTTVFWPYLHPMYTEEKDFLFKCCDPRFHNCALFLERLPNHGPRWNWDNGDSHAS